MPLVRTQCVFQGSSGLSEDRYVTNTHWNGAGTFFEVAAAASDRMLSFWTEDTTGGSPPGVYIAGQVQRSFQLRSYNMDLEPNAREPYIVLGTLPAPISATCLPSECAVALSWVAGTAPWSPAERGRFFIGPLVANAGIESGTLPMRVDDTFLNRTGAAAEALVGKQGNGGVDWVNVSRVFNKITRLNPLITVITGGFIDNAFDTIRSRGERATAREFYGSMA